MADLKKITGTPFEYYQNIETRLSDLHRRVIEMREVGKLNSQALERIFQYFKIKGIYHSNAIEGNSLTIGETELVVGKGMTISGKSLDDQAEAKNLSHAFDFMKDIAVSKENPITVSDLRQIHAFILKDIQDDHAGRYRDGEVKISGSDYKPPEAFLVPQEMDVLGAYLNQITSYDVPDTVLPILGASAAHAWLAQIHPFIDGNGRTARILMNLILMRQGYPTCIIMREERLRYYDALEESQASNLTPLIELIYENVEESLEVWEEAAEKQKEKEARLASIRERLEGPALNQVRNEYEVWHNAMELLRSYFKQTVDELNEAITFGSVRLNFKDFGTLDFEKYRQLRNEVSVKRTWFFGLEFNRGERRARYMFFSGYADYQLRQRAPVTLLVSKYIDYTYVKLEEINQSNIPDIYQIGFDMKDQVYVAKTTSGTREGKVEDLAIDFIEQVVKRDFST